MIFKTAEELCSQNRKLKRVPTRYPAHAYSVYRKVLSSGQAQQYVVHVGYFPRQNINVQIGIGDTIETVSFRTPEILLVNVPSHREARKYEIPVDYSTIPDIINILGGSFGFMKLGPYKGEDTLVAPLPMPHVFGDGRLCQEHVPSTDFMEEVYALTGSSSVDIYKQLLFLANIYWSSPMIYWDTPVKVAVPKCYLELDNPKPRIGIDNSPYYGDDFAAMRLYLNWLSTQSPKDLSLAFEGHEKVKKISEYMSAYVGLATDNYSGLLERRIENFIHVD